TRNVLTSHNSAISWHKSRSRLQFPNAGPLIEKGVVASTDVVSTSNQRSRPHGPCCRSSAIDAMCPTSMTSMPPGWPFGLLFMTYRDDLVTRVEKTGFGEE